MNVSGFGKKRFNFALDFLFIQGVKMPSFYNLPVITLFNDFILKLIVIPENYDKKRTSIEITLTN